MRYPIITRFAASLGLPLCATAALAVAGLSPALAQSSVANSAAIADSTSLGDTEAPVEAPAVTAPPVQGNLMNPNTSVIGWMQASAGHDAHDPAPSAMLKEAELGL